MPRNAMELMDRIESHDDSLGCLTQLLAPGVEGLELAKRAIILSMVSLDDRGSDRGRLHTLLYGPPGTAKTSPVKFAADMAGAPLFSPKTTEAGLTADLRNGNPGALPRMHETAYQLFAVDELDKMPSKNLEHLLQSMSDGEFTASSASVMETFDAEVRVLATANRTEGFAPELLDRFDFAVYVPRPDQEAAQEIMESVTGGFMQEGGKEEAYQQALKMYLDRARCYHPKFADQERARVSTVIRNSIEDDDVCIRSKVAVLRVAFALARVELSPVQVEHAEQAIDMLDEIDRRQP